MKEYRQGKLRREVVEGQVQPDNPAKREKLRKTQRLQSFKWRIATLLSPQYDILMCVQYGPEFRGFRADNGMPIIFSRNFCNNTKQILGLFPILRDFKETFEVGGDEIFKAFVLRKYNREFNQATDCVVGVLDKASLLDQLQKLPHQGGKRWETVFDRATIKAENKGHWRRLECSEELYHSGEFFQWWEERRMVCQPLRWTARKTPRWNSSALHQLLSEWAIGSRKIGLWGEHEALGASDVAWRAMISPIFRSDTVV
jgi:hypothetical protein